MTDANDYPSPPDRMPPQFSVRDLLKLTLACAVLLMICVLCRGSRYFGAFASPWAALSLVTIAIVWLMFRWRLAPPVGLARLSIILYLASLCVPALTLGGDLVFGGVAWLFSFLGVALFAEWKLSPVGETMWYPIASLMGAAANVAFGVGYIACLLSRWRNKPQSFPWRVAVFGTTLALLVLLPLALSSELNAIYPGYGLWAASFLALSFATHRSHLDSTQAAESL
jgi:hypothetical protein